MQIHNEKISSFLKNAIRTKKKKLENKAPKLEKGVISNYCRLTSSGWLFVKTKEKFPSPHFSVEMKKSKVVKINTNNSETVFRCIMFTQKQQQQLLLSTAYRNRSEKHFTDYSLKLLSTVAPPGRQTFIAVTERTTFITCRKPCEDPDLIYKKPSYKIWLRNTLHQKASGKPEKFICPDYNLFNPSATICALSSWPAS